VRSVSFDTRLDGSFGRDVYVCDFLLKIYHSPEQGYENIEDILWDILSTANKVKITIEELEEG